MKKGGIQNIPVSDPSPGKCAEHDKNLKLLCFDCNRLICRDCTLFEHCGHKFEFLTKCASESRNTLRESLAQLQKIQADIYLRLFVDTLACSASDILLQLFQRFFSKLLDLPFRHAAGSFTNSCRIGPQSSLAVSGCTHSITRTHAQRMSARG